MRKEQRPFLKPKTDQTEPYQILIPSDDESGGVPESQDWDHRNG